MANNEMEEAARELANLRDDYAHYEKSCWYCADPDMDDPFRCPEGHWHHMLDPGDGLLSPCANAERLESIFTEQVRLAEQRVRAEMDERIRKLEFMIDNGLGWKDIPRGE
jgi:hypothetical protein